MLDKSGFGESVLFLLDLFKGSSALTEKWKEKSWLIKKTALAKFSKRSSKVQ